MKKLIAALMLLAAPSFASPWQGKLDTTFVPYAAAYQSFTSATEVLGLEKRVLSVYYNGQEMIKFGVLAGESSGAVGVAPRAVAGPTFAVPGSLLDWSLGTTWGQQWLPKLKTGVIAWYDLARPSQAHWRPDGYGFGIAYPINAN